MAELFGIATGAMQVADAGTKLVKYLSSVQTAPRAIEAIAEEVRQTAIALQSLGELLKSDNAATTCTSKVLQDARAVFDGCKSTFADLKDLIKPGGRFCDSETGGLTFAARWTYPFKSTKIGLLRTTLASQKHTLMLMLSVLSFAAQSARK